ncbi:ketosteroid isomerase-related protein [Roseibium sp. SCP14]|uniref:ketosteroid isomerase-related protein n=1 Tax=Roseibium sp. SCP14 TaxID=3141375 RepID=UPI0033355B69
MPNKQSRFLIDTYFAAFNAGDTKKMESLVTEDLIHDVNQGERRIGKDKFWSFNVHMTRCYKERLSDIVLFVNEEGTRAAAEFIVHGTYINTDEGLPPADGQTYDLPAGSFFEIRDGQIARITTYYNLQNWIDQVNREPGEGSSDKASEEA